MADSRPHLVVGASGPQGASVLASLQRRGLRTRALVRSELDLARMRSIGADEAVVADLTVPDELARAVEQTESVFLVTPFEADLAKAVHSAQKVVEGLARGGAGHVVFNTGLIAGMPRVGIGSVDGKLATLEGLRAAGIRVVELGVTFYLENWLMPWADGRLLSEGLLTYPLPADAPVSWLAHADMGEAAAEALTRSDLAGSTVQLGGRTATPAQVATMVGQTLGRPVRFQQTPLPSFIDDGDAASGPARMGTAIGALYRWVLEEPHSRAAAGTDGLKSLSVSPTPLEQWVGSRNWTAERP